MSKHESVVLVTGSSGFIGSAAIRRFAAEYTVVGFDQAGALCQKKITDEKWPGGGRTLAMASRANVRSGKRAVGNQ